MLQIYEKIKLMKIVLFFVEKNFIKSEGYAEELFMFRGKMYLRNKMRIKQGVLEAMCT